MGVGVIGPSPEANIPAAVLPRASPPHSLALRMGGKLVRAETLKIAARGPRALRCWALLRGPRSISSDVNQALMGPPLRSHQMGEKV